MYIYIYVYIYISIHIHTYIYKQMDAGPFGEGRGPPGSLFTASLLLRLLGLSRPTSENARSYPLILDIH